MILDKKREIFVIATIIVVTGSFYLATIREGHDWGGDFAMYIHHAKNIAEGIHYKDTGYIYNYSYTRLGPETYPPVFPLLLLPVYKWFGLNLTVMKGEIILIFLLALFMLFLVFKEELPFNYAAAIITIIGFNPFFWEFKDQIRPDIPFLFFLYLSFFIIMKAKESHRSNKAQSLYSLLLGISMYLSYGTRSIGIILIPSFLIYDIIKSKRLTQFAIKAILVFALFMILQNIFLHNESSYLRLLNFNKETIFRRLYIHLIQLRFLWINGYSKSCCNVLFIIISGLATIGYLLRIRERITILEIFLLLYAIPSIIFIDVSTDMRYDIPLIPLYIFYAFIGIKRIGVFKQINLKRIVFTVLMIAIPLSYAGRYTKTHYGPIPWRVTKKESIELFEYIKRNTEERDVFIFRRPRVLSLFTGRDASVYHQAQNDKELWDYFREINASYIIVGKIFGEDEYFLRPFVERNKDNLREVYFNSDFKVYKIKGLLINEQ